MFMFLGSLLCKQYVPRSDYVVLLCIFGIFCPENVVTAYIQGHFRLNFFIETNMNLDQTAPLGAV